MAPVETTTILRALARFAGVRSLFFYGPTRSFEVREEAPFFFEQRRGPGPPISYVAPLVRFGFILHRIVVRGINVKHFGHANQWQQITAKPNHFGVANPFHPFLDSGGRNTQQFFQVYLRDGVTFAAGHDDLAGDDGQGQREFDADG
jgi:hypothetical protein